MDTHVESRPIIRAARTDEAGALTDLALRSKAMWGYDAAFMERCRPALTVTGEYLARNPVYVAEVDGRVAGFYALRLHARPAAPESGSAPEPRSDPEGRPGLELDLLFVEPGRTRGGIGSALLDHALDRARRMGHRELFLESDPFAEPFYLRAGGERRGEVASTAEAGRTLPMVVFRL